MWLIALPALAGPFPADLAFTGLDGKPHTVAELAGKVVLLDFWATWCGPCKRSLPAYDAWQTELGPQGFVVVGVSVDDTTKPIDAHASRVPPAIAKFAELHCPGVTVWWDEGHRAAEKLEIAAMPTAFLIGRDGEMALRHEGFDGKDAEKLRAEVLRLLAAPP